MPETVPECKLGELRHASKQQAENPPLLSPFAPLCLRSYQPLAFVNLLFILISIDLLLSENWDDLVRSWAFYLIFAEAYFARRRDNASFWSWHLYGRKKQHRKLSEGIIHTCIIIVESNQARPKQWRWIDKTSSARCTTWRAYKLRHLSLLYFARNNKTRKKKN